MICPRCQGWLTVPAPRCPGCGWRLAKGDGAVDAIGAPTHRPVAVVVQRSTQPTPTAIRARELFEAEGLGRDGLLVLIVTEARRVELVVGLDAEGRVELASLAADWRERVLPLLRADDVEAAVAAITASLPGAAR